MSAILRLYNEYVDLVDRAARPSQGEHRTRIEKLESEICHHLLQHGGIIVVGQFEFRAFEVKIGKDKHLHTRKYFRVITTRERPAGSGGYSFARCDVTPDPVLPVSAQHRKHHEVAA